MCPINSFFLEDSEHELLDVSEDDSDVTDVTGLVDHVTVRNAEEAELYSHRKKIAEKLFEKEKKYLYYLRCLEKLYIAFSNNARLRIGSQITFSPNLVMNHDS